MINSEPVFVALLSNQCQHCQPILTKWNEIITVMLKVYPKLRFPQTDPSVLATKHFSRPPIMVTDGTFNTYLYPADLKRYYNKWTPFIMLVPGPVWDQCHVKMGPGNMTKLEPVHVMNSKLINGDLLPYNVYDQNDPKSYGIWLEEIMNSMLSPLEIIDKLPPRIMEKIDDDSSKKQHSKKWTCNGNLLNLIG